tara:strand:- start:314 stop:496 length:183 start_codon:yes stop_codon:yes gene_type:complete
VSASLRRFSFGFSHLDKIMLKLTIAVRRLVAVAAFCLLIPAAASAQSIVQVETSAGTFFI